MFHLFARQQSTDTLIGLGDDVPFEVRLAQTIAWCNPRADAAKAATSLRDGQLRPRVLERDRAATVRSVLHARSADAAVRCARPVGTLDDLCSGRLLVYFPDAELADGAAESEAGGFYDVNDTPPWDTWVGLFADPDPTLDSPVAEYLICWVPRALLDVAESGIRVSMVDCIAWLETTNIAVARQLRAKGLFGE